MKIVGFDTRLGTRLGVVDGDHVVDLQAVDGTVPADLGVLLGETGGDLGRVADLARRAPASARHPLEGLTFALPVARPGKIVCLGLNYLEHVKEGVFASAVPEFPTIFMRCLTSLAPHLAPLVRPRVSEEFDYEAELVAVIGRRARHMTVANALTCIAGYSCVNEGSIRDFQRRTSQWTIGKNFDRTGGFGPWMVSADELPPGGRGLKIESRLNGRVMQSDNTDSMMFQVAETIADLTQAMTLEPGDLVVMGTPPGVGFARKPPVWMRHGDVCEIEIEGIGVLRNPIQDEVV